MPTTNDLRSLANSNLPDNSTRQISAKDSRDVHLMTANVIDEQIANWAGSGTIYPSRSALATEIASASYPQGAIFYVQSRRYRVDARGPDGLLVLDMDWSGRLERLIARMADNQTVNFAAYGDSTTDGNNTPDWTPNPVDGNGNAVGSAAHDPAFAWPAQMHDILRAMYGSNGINVWNAGYGGKAILTGWAVANFNRAIIDNPAYGIPHACIINFGANDIAMPNFDPDAFSNELRYLLNLLDYYGIVPILMTPDPIARPDRQAGLIQKLNEIYRAASEEFSIELIDSHQALQDVFSGNSKNGLWHYNQMDGLHFNGVGHRVKGSYAAARLFTNTLWADGAEEVIDVAPWSRHANTHKKNHYVFDQLGDGLNGKFGGTVNINGGSYALGETLMDMWAWVKGSEYEAFYHSIDGDGYYHPRPRETGPTLDLYHYTSNAIVGRPSQSAGRRVGVTGNRPTEEPQQMGQVMGGLVRLRFNAPTDTAAELVNLGYFSLRKIRWPVTYARWIAPGSGALMSDNDPTDDRPTALGGGYGKFASIVLDMTMPNGAGFALLGGRVFGTSGAAVAMRRRALVMVRAGAELQLRNVVFDASGVIANDVLDSGAYTWSETSNLFRVALTVLSTGQHLVQIAAAATPLAPIIAMQRAVADAPHMFGGSPGAVFKDYSTSPAAGIAKMTIFDTTYANV